VLQSRARAVVRRAAYLTPVLKEYLADRVRLRDELAVRVREAAAQKELLEEAIMARIRLGAEVEHLASEVEGLRAENERLRSRSKARE